MYRASSVANVGFYDMIYLLTAIGLSAGGRSHKYKQYNSWVTETESNRISCKWRKICAFSVLLFPTLLDHCLGVSGNYKQLLDTGPTGPKHVAEEVSLMVLNLVT